MALRPRIGWDESTPIETSTIIPHVHDESLLNEPTSAPHPEVNLLASRAASAEAQAKQQNRWWLPTVDVYGTYQLYTLRERFYPALQDRFDWSVGVRLRMELFEGLQKVKEADSGFRSSQALQTMAQYRSTMADTEIRLTREEIKHIHELIHGAEEAIGKGNRLLTLSADEYDRGVRTSSDMLSVADRMFGLQKTHAARRRDYQKAKTKLLSLLGR